MTTDPHVKPRGTEEMPMNTADTITVLVRDHAAEDALWGHNSGPFTPAIRRVEIAATCPQCGGPRGEIRGSNESEDGAWYFVNVWTNACGHVDMYPAVLAEAAKLAEAKASAPVLLTRPDGTSGQLAAGDVRALMGYIEQRDGISDTSGCEHKWVDMPEGTPFTQGVPFRFCSHCDREEWANGVIRPGGLPLTEIGR